jgi:hypothetical protein
MEATRSSKTSVNIAGLHGVTFQKSFSWEPKILEVVMILFCQVARTAQKYAFMFR